MNNQKKLGENFLLFFLGGFASKLLSFLFLPLYTSILTTAEYGIADIITTSISLISPLFTVAIYEANLRFALESEVKKEQVFCCSLVIFIIGSLLFLIVSPITLLINVLKPYYSLFIIYYILYTFNNLISYFSRGLNKVKDCSISGIINTILVIFSNLLFLMWLKIGIIGYLISFIIGCMGSIIFLLISIHIRKYLIKLSKIDKSLINQMIRYSLPLIPNSINWWICNSSDKYMLTFFYTTAITGTYSVAYKIPSILSIIGGFFISAWRLSAVHNFGTQSTSKFYQDIYEKFIGICFIIASLLILGNKILASVLYSKNFYMAWQYVPILVVAIYFHLMGDFWGTIYTSSKKTIMLFYSSLAGAVSNIILNYFLIPRYAAFGAAYATLFSYILIYSIRKIDSTKIFYVKTRILSNLISCLFLLLQMVVAVIDHIYSTYFSLFSFVIIFIINRKPIYELVLIMIRAIKGFYLKKDQI